MNTETDNENTEPDDFVAEPQQHPHACHVCGEIVEYAWIRTRNGRCCMKHVYIRDLEWHLRDQEERAAEKKRTTPKNR